MSPRTVIVTVAVLDLIGAGFAAVALASFMSPAIAALFAFGPIVVVFGLVLGGMYRKQRRGESLNSDTSFGSAARYRASAWNLALGGCVMGAIFAVYFSVDAGICFAIGMGAFALSSVALAAHSE